jgi:hypothetical protein
MIEIEFTDLISMKSILHELCQLNRSRHICFSTPCLFICVFVTTASDALSFIIKHFGNITLHLFQGTSGSWVRKKTLDSLLIISYYNYSVSIRMVPREFSKISRNELHCGSSTYGRGVGVVWVTVAPRMAHESIKPRVQPALGAVSFWLLAHLRW